MVGNTGWRRNEKNFRITATAFTFKKYKKAPKAHILGSRGMLSPLQGVNEGDSVPLTK